MTSPKEPAWKSIPPPETNSRWDANNRTFRVMGVIEGYVICRHSGRMPFVVHLSDWHKKYTAKPAPKRSRT